MMRRVEYDKLRERIKELLAEGLTACVIAERLGCTPNFVYRVKRKEGED